MKFDETFTNLNSVPFLSKLNKPERMPLVILCAKLWFTPLLVFIAGAKKYWLSSPTSQQLELTGETAPAYHIV
jgi:hypothetical protein